MKVIAVGSGHNMTNVNDWDTDGLTLIGVNNTWKGTDKLHYLFHAGDYPEKNKIPSHMRRITRTGESNFKESYCSMSGMEWKEARKFLGLPIYFGVSYWILHYLKPSAIGYIGFDMNYVPQDGKTAFYGTGIDIQKRGMPDPLYQIKKEYGGDENIMNTLFDRLNERKGNTALYNLSTDENSVLPWDKITFEEFKSL